jgi:hypothetical protein
MGITTEVWVLLPAADGVATVPGYRRLYARERSLLLGGTLVVLGVVLLAKELGVWRWLDLRWLWPLLLIAGGVALLIDRTRGVR